MRVWRISNYADLSGKGGVYTAARWNHMETPIVYCADHPASALLEILVNAVPESWPDSFQLLEIDVPDDIHILNPTLPTDWKDRISLTWDIGTGFITEGIAPLMRIPSAIISVCWNYLLNPNRPESARIRIVSVTHHPVDPRLKRR